MGFETDEECDTSTNDESNSISELENELYSIVHYTGLNENISEDILNKYNIQQENNELIISLKPAEEVNGDSISADDDDGDECSNEIIVENRVSKIDDNRNNLSEEIRLDSSDSDSDCVIIEEKNTMVTKNNKSAKKKAKISVEDSSDESVVALSDVGSSSGVILNLEKPKECVVLSDSENCLDGSFGDGTDFKLTKHNWKEVVSPDSWTSEMKKYYNAPSKRLRQFDDEKIRKKIRGRSTDWFIIDLDRYSVNMSYLKCCKCKRRGHIGRNCTEYRKNCHMCGTPGHKESSCPDHMCLNCGTLNQVFISICSNCESQRAYKCRACHKKGHREDICPDSWRKYHNTISGPVQNTSTELKKKKYCCNCAQEGHLFEHCTQIYWSPYPKVYSFVTDYEGEAELDNTTRIYLTKDVKFRGKELNNIIGKYKAKGMEFIQNFNGNFPYMDVRGPPEQKASLQNEINCFLRPRNDKPFKKRKGMFKRRKHSFN